MKRRLLILLVFTTVTLGLQAQTTTASSYAGGTGTKDDPYQISTLAELRRLSETPADWDSNFVLTSSIDASDTRTWNSGAGMASIGERYDAFSGDFNGNGNTISNLYINRPSTTQLGLFGTARGGHILNLGLINCDITGYLFTGSIVGNLYGATLSNCFASGKVSLPNDYGCGGLCGQVYEAWMKNCFSTVEVTTPSTGGGLIGNLFDSHIENCYATGKVKAGTSTGGLIGQIGNCSTLNCYYDSTTSGQQNSASGIAYCTDSFAIAGAFTDWDFEDVWRIETFLEIDSVPRPYLSSSICTAVFKSSKGGSLEGVGLQYFLKGSDTSSTPVKAIADRGYSFVKWQTNDGKFYSSQNPITISEFSTDISLVAVFENISGGVQIQKQEFAFEIYPNPAKNDITIKYGSDARISIISLDGKIMLDNIFVEEQIQTQIDISSLSSGMYLLNVQSEKGIEVKSFLIK